MCVYTAFLVTLIKSGGWSEGEHRRKMLYDSTVALKRMGDAWGMRTAPRR